MPVTHPMITGSLTSVPRPQPARSASSAGAAGPTTPSHLITRFTSPATAASGPGFVCPRCARPNGSHEWTRDYDSRESDAYALRCGCGRRYRWARGRPCIETELTRWHRTHSDGTCTVAMRSATGWFDYGHQSAVGAVKTRWLGQTRLLEKAQTMADEAVAPHDCACPAWSGEPD